MTKAGEITTQATSAPAHRTETVAKQAAAPAPQPAYLASPSPILDRRGMLALQRLAGNQACLSLLSGGSMMTPLRLQRDSPDAGTSAPADAGVPGGAAPLTDEQRRLSQIEEGIRNSQWDQAVRDLALVPAASAGAMLTGRTLDQLSRLKEAADRLSAATVAAMIEPRRIAQLNADYTAALTASNWARVAILLNAYNQPDQRTRLAALNLVQLTALKQAADVLGWPGLIAVIETRRVEQLNADYTAAVSAGAVNWIRVAELLNVFNDSDIATRIAALTRAQRTQLLAGARQATTIGTADRIINQLHTVTGRQPGRIFGTVTTTQAPHDATAPGGGYSFEFRIVFSPDPSVVDSSQIAFVQTSRLVDLGTSANAEYMEPQNSRRNALNEAIDRIAGRKYGWYGFNNDLTTAGTITPGVSPGPPVVDAHFYDRPADSLANVSFNFETSIASRQGPQANLVYSVVHWGFNADASGHLAAHSVVIEDRPTAGFGTAVAAWNAQAAGPVAGRNAPDQQSLPTFR